MVARLTATISDAYIILLKKSLIVINKSLGCETKSAAHNEGPIFQIAYLYCESSGCQELCKFPAVPTIYFIFYSRQIQACKLILMICIFRIAKIFSRGIRRN